MAGVPKRVAALATVVRELKAQLAKEGLSSAAINRHEQVLASVRELKELKAQLGGDDPATDEAFFARQRAAKEEARRLEQTTASAQRDELRAAEARAPRPLTQRKIFHLFRSAGSGPTFRYEPPPRLNTDQTGFGGGGDPHPAVYVTEKWDGTTVQATCNHIFKRLDLWGKRREGHDPAQRYDLRLLAWRDECSGSEWRGLDFADADFRVHQGLRPYLQMLAALPQGLCVYFEVVHTEINTTFRHLPDYADMRVFDFSREGQGFLPFEECVRLAAETGLPLVGWSRREALGAEELWKELAAAAADKRRYHGVNALLEGFVVREAGSGDRVAKARVEQVAAGIAAGAGGSGGSEVRAGAGGSAKASAKGGSAASTSARRRSTGGPKAGLRDGCRLRFDCAVAWDMAHLAAIGVLGAEGAVEAAPAHLLLSAAECPGRLF